MTTKLRLPNKIISLEPGMYLLTYIKTVIPQANSVITFSQLAAKEIGVAHFFFSDINTEGMLLAPGDFVVIRISHAKTNIQIQIHNQQADINPDVVLKLDEIGRVAAKLKNKR